MTTFRLLEQNLIMQRSYTLLAFFFMVRPVIFLALNTTISHLATHFFNWSTSAMPQEAQQLMSPAVKSSLIALAEHHQNIDYCTVKKVRAPPLIKLLMILSSLLGIIIVVACVSCLQTSYEGMNFLLFCFFLESWVSQKLRWCDNNWRNLAWRIMPSSFFLEMTMTHALAIDN